MTDWDHSADFVIIGSGGGGLTAAIAAADDGLSVVVLEKQSMIGGSTAMSGGVVWLPNNPVMAEDRIDDSFDAGMAYFEDVVGEVGPASSTAKRAAFLTEGSAMITALRKHGMRFERADGYSDYYSNAEGGNEAGRSLEPLPYDARKLGDLRHRLMPGMAKHIGLAVKTNELRAIQYFNRSIPSLFAAARVFLRTHVSRLLGKDLLTNGGSLMGQMLEIVNDNGTPIWLDSAVSELIVHDGRVVGAKVVREGRTVNVEGRSGVLIASGGFGHNAAMRSLHSGDQPNDGSWSMANPGDTGEVLRCAIELGAQTDLMDEAWWLPSTIRELGGSTLGQARQRPGAILVDNNGARFCNEANSMVEVAKAMYDVGAVPCWAITDERYRRRYANGMSLPGHMPKEWFTNGWVKTAPTVEELAEKIEVDPDALASTVARFNQHARDGKDPDFGRGESAYNRCMGDPAHKPNPALGPLDKGPFYAVQIFPADVGTCGGLIADEHGRVLGDDGAPISGLYATGNATATVMGRSYLGAGGSIAYGMIFGFVAARHAAGVHRSLAASVS